MLSFKIIGLLVLEKKVFKGFYHIWAWWPSWSCDQDHLYKLSFTLPKEAPHEIWHVLAKWFQRRCLKIMALYMYIARGLGQTTFKHEYLRDELADRKFYLKHYWGGGKAALGFGADQISTLDSMATDSSHRVIMGKTVSSRFLDCF